MACTILVVNHAGHNIISGLFRGGVSSGAVCPSRGPPQASSSPLEAYNSPAGHRITPHNLTSPLYFPLSTYILVEQPPPHYAQRLDWVRGHHMPRDQHASLTCRAEGTICLSLGLYDGVFACAAPTCISRQTRAAWSSGVSLSALCCKAACLYAPSPSHHTTQSNKPPIPPAVYIYSGRASSSENRTETRLGKRA